MVVETTGSRIRAARERAGLLQQELADLVGVTRTTVGNWESDLHPPRGKMGKIREILRLDEHLRPLGSAETYDLTRMDNAELIARMNVLMAGMNSLASEVARRLSAYPELDMLEDGEMPESARYEPGFVSGDPDASEGEEKPPSTSG